MTPLSADSVEVTKYCTLYIPCKLEERSGTLKAAARRLSLLRVASQVAVVAEDELACVEFLRACVDESIVSGCEYLEVVHAGCSACLTYHVGDDLERHLADLGSQHPDVEAVAPPGLR
jgi:hypothetical protein